MLHSPISPFYNYNLTPIDYNLTPVDFHQSTMLHSTISPFYNYNLTPVDYNLTPIDFHQSTMLHSTILPFYNYNLTPVDFSVSCNYEQHIQMHYTQSWYRHSWSLVTSISPRFKFVSDGLWFYVCWGLGNIHVNWYGFNPRADWWNLL